MSEQNTEAPVETTEAPQETQDTGQQEAPQLGIDPALDARLNELASGIGNLTQGFQQMQEAQYEDPYQQQQYQQQEDPYNGLDPNDPRDAQMIQMQQGYQQLQQQTERMANDAYQRDLQGLTQRIPELDKPEVAGPVVEQARGIMQQLGMDPQGMIPVQLIETAFKAHTADQYASKQQPLGQVQQQQAHLEGSGATPQQPAQDPLDEIFPAEQQQPRSVFGF